MRKFKLITIDNAHFLFLLRGVLQGTDVFMKNGTDYGSQRFCLSSPPPPLPKGEISSPSLPPTSKTFPPVGGCGRGGVSSTHLHGIPEVHQGYGRLCCGLRIT